jgi:hypothetical protein
MPTAAPVRTVKASEVDETYDPYAALVAAILARAVQDAQGHCWSPGPQRPDQIQAEARRWLQDETAVRDLVELCGAEAAPVLSRIRRVLVDTAPRASQLPLFVEAHTWTSH